MDVFTLPIIPCDSTTREIHLVPTKESFPYLGCQQVPSGAFAGCRQILHRRLPGMASEREFGIVCGQDIAGPQIRGRLRRFVRQHVDAVPLTVVLTVFQQGQVEAAKLFADGAEMCAIPTVAAVIHLALRRHDGKRGPLRRVLREQTA